MTVSREERFRALYRAEVIALLGYAARRASRADDAADVVAEVFTVAWRRIDDVPLGSDARPWLFGVARNVLANARRSEARHDRLSDRLRGELRLMEASAEARVADADHVRRALARLSPDDRELLLLTSWEGLAPAAISVAMDLPPGTVRSRLHRARQQMRAELGRDLEQYAASGHVQGGGQRPATEPEEST